MKDVVVRGKVEIGKGRVRPKRKDEIGRRNLITE